MKKFLALLLVLCMAIALFAACATSGNEADKPADGEKENKPVDDKEPADDGEDEGDAEDEMVEISFKVSDTGVQWTNSDGEAVMDAINELVESEINVHVNFDVIASADYATQVNLAVANQEPFDIATYSPGIAGSFLTFYTNGVLMDITDLLDNEGKDVKELFGEELLAMTTIEGRIYGLPTYRLLNSSMYWVAVKDTLEGAGGEAMIEQAQNMKSWADLEAIFEAIKNSDSTATAFGSSNVYGLLADPGAIFGGTLLTDVETYDILGDSLYVIYSDQNGNVGLLQDQQGFVEQCKMVRNWMDKGYVWADTPFDTTGSETLMGQGVFASYFTQSEFGLEVNKTQQIGKECVCVELAPSYLSTTQGQKFGIFVSATSEEPEAAVKFINLLYTNKDLMNLWIYGIEGQNWVLKDGVGEYPEGKNSAGECGWHGMDFTIGNQFLVYPWKGLYPEFREKAMENFLNCKKSAYIGFTLDTSAYETMMAGITNVVNEYMKQITGGLYTDEMYDEFMAKLESAQIRDWVKLYQDALTAWLG